MSAPGSAGSTAAPAAPISVGMTNARAIIDWLLAAGIGDEDPLALVDGLLRRLNDAGVPVWRLGVSMSTIDPLLRGLSLIAWRDRPPAIDSATHDAAGEAAFQASPIHWAQARGLMHHRWRLGTAAGADGVPMLLQLRDEGATDYVLQLVTFDSRRSVANGAALTFASDAPGGFEDRHLALLAEVIPVLGLVAKCISVARTSVEALSVYLGPRTGQRVLGGEIRRGSGQTISAAVMIADLRGFTAVADRTDPLGVVGLLDQHFELIGAAVERYEGEVLKFLGDGLLAIFPFEDDPPAGRRACDHALAAAEQALETTGALNRARRGRGEPAMQLDIALNAGEVVYGNVGAARRLDFTVIGSAVNEAARIERFCEPLDRNLLVSESFAGLCSRPVVEIGRSELRGLSGERRILAHAA